MPVLRQHHTRDFTVIPNALLQDQRLSLRDVGLLVWMLSKPSDWKFTKKYILAEISQDGDRSLQAAVKKLQDTGYLTITRGDRKKENLRKVFGQCTTHHNCKMQLRNNHNLENRNVVHHNCVFHPCKTQLITK